jgi:hypothetical protein
MNNALKIISRQSCLNQIDLALIRLVCHSWKNQANQMWQDYCDYAQKRATIWTTYPKDIIHYDGNFYVRSIKLYKLNAKHHHMTPESYGKKNDMDYKCYRDTSNRFKLVVHSDCEMYEGYKKCDIENICFQLEDQVKESDIIIIHKYSNGTHHGGEEHGNILLTKCQGEIIKYGSKAVFPTEEYNIKYFSPLLRYLPNEHTAHPAGFLIDYREQMKSFEENDRTEAQINSIWMDVATLFRVKGYK